LETKPNIDENHQDQQTYVEGRDDLNLAEFPLASISNIRKDNDKIIEFEDSIYDKERQKIIIRKLTIAASSKHGLPTAIDDEVILGLIQLSKIQGFTERKVYFSRYQLIKILGWKDHSENYRRIEEALNRWSGLFLDYEKAWRDKNRNTWVDAKFHIIDNVEIHRQDDPLSPDRCSFTWNDVVFENFAAGNLKKLNFDLYRQLKSAIAKRMYRFLDKKFYLKKSIKFDLQDFAYNKIGISKSAQTAQIKQRLDKAIEELGKIGFLEQCSKSERYEKISPKKWLIHFVKGSTLTDSKEETFVSVVESEIEKKLVDHGVTRDTAKKFLKKYPETYLRDKIDAFEYLLLNKNASEVKNKGGYLAKAIRLDYAPLDGFLTREECVKQERLKEEEYKKKEEKKREKQKAEQQKKEEEERKEKERKQFVDDYLGKLDTNEVKEIYQQATSAADHEIGKMSSKVKRDSFFWKISYQMNLQKIVAERCGLDWNY